MPPPNLAQRLYATSGRATLADLPFLYYGLDPAQAAKAKAQGAGPAMQGEPALQNLASLDPSGGGAPTSGGGGVTFPAAEAISAPGRAGGGSGNALRDLLGRSSEDIGRGEGGGFTGANNLTSYSDRYADIARRGTADFTLDNIAKALGFGLSLSGASPFSIAAGEALKALGVDTGMGVPEFTGESPIVGKPRSFGELMAAIDASRAEAERSRVIGPLDSAFAKERAMRRATGNLNFFGGASSFGSGGGGGGGYGGSYGEAGPKGPGGTLGHI